MRLLAPNNSAGGTGRGPMETESEATGPKARKPRTQGPSLCFTELLALFRTGCTVSTKPVLPTVAELEEAMGREWPAQLDRAAEEHGWCEKNLKKRYCGEPWTLAAAKKVRVDLKRLWPHFRKLKSWCLDVANPIYMQFLDIERSESNEIQLEPFMVRVLWLQEAVKKNGMPESSMTAVETFDADAEDEGCHAPTKASGLHFKDCHELHKMTKEMPSDFKGPAQLRIWLTCGPVGENSLSLALPSPNASHPAPNPPIAAPEEPIGRELGETTEPVPKRLRLLTAANTLGRLLGFMGAHPQPWIDAARALQEGHAVRIGNKVYVADKVYEDSESDA